MCIGDDADDHIETLSNQPKHSYRKGHQERKRTEKNLNFLNFPIFLCGLRVLCGKQVWLIASC